MKLMQWKLPRNRELRIQARLEPCRIYLLPGLRVNNWLPRYPFFHLSLVALVWAVDIWWMRRR